MRGPIRSDLLFACPHTNRLIETGLDTDAKSLGKMWQEKLALSCPHCGMTHNLVIREAFLEHVLRSGVGHELSSATVRADGKMQN